MATWRRWRPWPIRGRHVVRKRPSGRYRKLWLSGWIGVAAALLLILCLDIQLRPVLEAMATAQVRNVVTRHLDELVAREVARLGLGYGDMVRLETGTDGAVTTLTSDMTRLNELRTSLVTAAIEDIGGIATQELTIPVGNLTGLQLLSGRGFSLPVQVVSVRTVRGAFSSLFTDAGINQTRHQIMLEMTADLDILLPGETMRTEVVTQVPVAETIIVGTVPEAYVRIGP